MANTKVKYSDDGGKTWFDLKEINGSFGRVLCSYTGRIWIFYLKPEYLITDPYHYGSYVFNFKIFYIYSDDFGFSWSDEFCMDSYLDFVFEAPIDVIEHYNGSIIISFYRALGGLITPWIGISNDLCQNWTYIHG